MLLAETLYDNVFKGVPFSICQPELQKSCGHAGITREEGLP
jgi:prophage DNA circulation protein